MSQGLHPGHPGVSVYVCHRCLPDGGQLPRQWTQDGIRVQVIVLPCTGKTDTQYLFHAIEAGAQGLLVVACPLGECRLGQGNYRAEIRIRTVRRLLAEIGMEPERAGLVHCAEGDDLKRLVCEAVGQFRALGENEVERHDGKRDSIPGEVALGEAGPDR
ncbi:MAG: hydrogenase iron-sulfur subunit [Thermodesulfobacteriota bacterium]